MFFSLVASDTIPQIKANIQQVLHIAIETRVYLTYTSTQKMIYSFQPSQQIISNWTDISLIPSSI